MMKTAFIYPNGRISGEETTLLSDRMWQMLMAASGEDEVMRLLGDTWYGSFMQYSSMEECFARAMEATEEELLELSEDPRLVRGILHRRDVRNARYIWKNLISGGDSDGKIELERSGLIETDLLKRSVDNPQIREELSDQFRKTLERILEKDITDPSAIDTEMDRLASGVEQEELTDVNPEFETFVKTHIQQKNFLTAGRLFIEEVPRQEMEELLLPGGFNTEEELAEAYQRGNLPDLLSETPGFEDTADALRQALESGSFLVFERECDRRLLELLEKGAFPVFGPSPLASFVIRREMEINHLKLLLAAKTAGVSEKRLRQRLPRG